MRTLPTPTTGRDPRRTSGPSRSSRPSRPPGSGRDRTVFRLMLLGLLFVGLLVWPSPQIGAYLAAQGYASPGDAIRAAADWAIRTTINIPEKLDALADPHAQHQYWQVGLGAGREDTGATGMRAEMDTRLPQRVADQTTNYFWVGAYLRDNSFIQAGYYVRWDDQSHAGWFYCAFHPDQSQGPCAYGDPGSAGDNAAQHTYTLAAAKSASGGFTWRAEMDGTALGSFDWPVGDTGTFAPTIYAESSGFAAHGPDSHLGPVDFRSGILVRHAGTTDYVKAARQLVQYNFPNVCPPYGLAADGHGGALIGSDEPCPDHFAPLG
jgi:hypothetical protein